MRSVVMGLLFGVVLVVLIPASSTVFGYPPDWSFVPPAVVAFAFGHACGATHA
jgi:hypothetical protein